MIIQSSSCLMPNHLPGNLQNAYKKVQMVPTPSGRVIILGIDNDDRFIVWLADNGGFTAWKRITFKPFSQDDPVIPKVLMFDHHLSADGTTFDLLLLTSVKGVNQVFYLPDAMAVADAEYWELLFSRAAPLKFYYLENTALWGVKLDPAKKDGRHFIAYGKDSINEAIAFSCLLTGNGEANAHRMLLPFYPASDEYPFPFDNFEMICGQLVLDEELTTVYYLSISNSENQVSRLWVFKWDDESKKIIFSKELFPPPPFSAGSFINQIQVVADSSGQSTLWFSYTWNLDYNRMDFCFLTPEETLQSGIAKSAWCSLTNYYNGPKGHFQVYNSSGGDTLAYQLALPEIGAAASTSAMYLMQTSSPQSGDAISTLVAGAIISFCACECKDPDSNLLVRHILLCAATGHMQLLSLDPVSEKWSPFALLDGNMKGVTEMNSFTTRIVIRDDTNAPMVNSLVTIKPEYPVMAFVDGKAIHLSTEITQAISTGSSGEITLISLTSDLSTPRFTVEGYIMPERKEPMIGFQDLQVLTGLRVGASLFVDPSASVVQKLKAVNSATSLKNQRGSNGQYVFPTDLPHSYYDNAYTGLQKYLEAYDSTQKNTEGVKRWDPAVPQAVMERTVFTWKYGQPQVEVLEKPEIVRMGAHRLQTFAGVDNGSIWSRLSNILSYLWTEWNEVKEKVVVVLDKLANGLYSISVTVGSKVLSFVFELGSQVLGMLDWFFQTSLQVGFRDMVNWLGYVFDWQDILKNKEAVKQVSGIFFNAIPSALKNAKPEVREAFKQIRDYIAAPPVFDKKSREILDQKVGSGTKGLEDDSPFSGPVAQWGMNKIKAYSESSDLKTEPVDETLARMLLDIFKDESDEVKQVVAAITKYFEEADIKTKSFLEIFNEVIKIIVTGAVDALEILTVALVDLFEKIVEIAQIILNTRFEIPVLTALYEEHIDPGSQFTLFNCLSLLGSCVTTIGYKLAFDKDVFSPRQLKGIAAAKDVDQLINALTGDSMISEQDYAYVIGVLQVLASVSGGFATICQFKADRAMINDQYPWPRGTDQTLLGTRFYGLVPLFIISQKIYYNNPDIQRYKTNLITAYCGLWPFLFSATKRVAFSGGLTIAERALLLKGLYAVSVVAGLVMLAVAGVSTYQYAITPMPPGSDHQLYDLLIAGASVKNFFSAIFLISEGWVFIPEPESRFIIFVIRSGVNASKAVVSLATGITIISTNKVNVPLIIGI